LHCEQLLKILVRQSNLKSLPVDLRQHSARVSGHSATPKPDAPQSFGVRAGGREVCCPTVDATSADTAVFYSGPWKSSLQIIASDITAK
jgi:hypothetical protein